MMSSLIINTARDCIGTPFRHQGRIAGKALDCAGLVVHIARSLNFKYQDVSGYERSPHKDLLKKVLDSQICLQRIDVLEPGCVVLFRIRTEPQHLAIFTGETIIHAYETVGRVVEERCGEFWKKRVIAAYRMVSE